MRQNVIEFRNYIKSLEAEHKTTKTVARMSSKNPEYNEWKTAGAQSRYISERYDLNDAYIAYYFVKHPTKMEFQGNNRNCLESFLFKKKFEQYYDKPTEE